MSTLAHGNNIAGRYIVESEIARGGMGFVCRVLDTATGTRVALKRLLPTAAANTHVVRLFESEYYTLVQLQHPRIIEVYDYGIDGDCPYYTMELLDGKDFRELAPLAYQEACQHARDVASSLALLHARRLLHRDLTARNVRLTSEGRAKVIDFGALATFGITGQVVGTPAVVPPEAINGQPLDQRADLYALGCLMYWLLTAKQAYPAQKLHALPSLWRQGEPPSPSKIVTSVPRELDQLVMALLSLDPASRPSSAAEVIERLNVIGGLDSEEIIDVGHSYISNPRLVGREPEMEGIRDFLERIVQEDSASLFVQGESGIGKTRILEELSVEGRLKGASVLRADAELHRGAYAVVRALASALFASVPDLALAYGRRYAAVLVSAFPELAEKFQVAEGESLDAEPSEQRIQLPSALQDWFVKVASERPLVLAIDNAHAADEASLAFCLALPRLKSNAPIGVVVTCRTGDVVIAERALGALSETSDPLMLAGLSPQETTSLVRALFGDVDHAGRLGRWLHDRTDGNPMQALAMAGQLIAEDHITYRDGAWVLPAELSREQLPSGMDQVLARRMAQLGPKARALAEAVSIERGAFSIEECGVLADLHGEDVFAALGELVSRGILVGAGDEYRFTQFAVPKYLREHLPPEKKRTLHARAGEFLFAIPDADPLTKIDAGWHLLRAGEESRGAQILAAMGGEFVHTVEGLAIAAPALEAALEVFERKGCSKWVLLNVLEALTAAGWYVDRSYATKYGERTLALALELTAHHGEATGQIDVDRYRHFEDLVQSLIGTLAILIGIAASTFDGRAARKYLETADVLETFAPDHVKTMVVDYCRYFVDVTEGRLTRAESTGRRVLDWLRSNDAERSLGLSMAKALAGAQMTGLGTYAALSGTPDALEWAKELEGHGLSFYRQLATQIRFIYHVNRGEILRAFPYREQLELNAMQGGTTWQASILVPLILGIAYSMCGELAKLRQSAEEIERMAKEIPSLAPVARWLRASYHSSRGLPQDAIPLLEQAVLELTPWSHVFWALVHASYIRALLDTGHFEQGLALGKRLSAEITADERRHGLLFLDLEMAIGLAEANCGASQDAAQRLDLLIDEQQSNESPIVLALLHETRARIAQKTADISAISKHIDAMGTWARTSGNTALIAKWKRLQAEAELKSVPVTFAAVPVDGSFSVYADAIRAILQQHEGRERARAALRLLMENANASRGYLYLGAPPHFVVAAQLPEHLSAPQHLMDEILSLAVGMREATPGPETADRLTGTQGFSTCAPVTTSDGDLFASHLLVVPQPGEAKIIGAVALKRDVDADEHISEEILQTVARCLYEPETPAAVSEPAG